jgi:glycosyltransferase involved in cell wall biosynthesis
VDRKLESEPQNELVSIAIPAYNQPSYTRKTLQSIVEQNYRPIEVVLSDDCSPASLEPLAEEFSKFADDNFIIKYQRQSTNLGFSGNLASAVKKTTGKYLIPLPHDNWFIDKNYITQAVEAMEQNPECYLCIANSILEHLNDEMLKIPDKLNAKDRWIFLKGDNFIQLWRKGGMGWTQSSLMDKYMALSLGAFYEPFSLSPALAAELDTAQDDVFAPIFLLSSAGDVALNGKVVSIAGCPEGSYSQSEIWKKTKKKTKFVIFYNLYRANLEGENAQAVKEMAKKQALDYVEQLLDFKLLRYYHYSIEMLPLMGLAIIKILKRLVKKTKKRAMQLFGVAFDMENKTEKKSNKTPKKGKSIQKSVISHKWMK